MSFSVLGNQMSSSTMGSAVPAFTIKEEPVENLRPLKVRVIGAGYSGILLGIRIPQRLRNIDLQIYEKNDGIGGTWFENRYPGCACDIPCIYLDFSFLHTVFPSKKITMLTRDCDQHILTNTPSNRTRDGRLFTHRLQKYVNTCMV